MTPDERSAVRLVIEVLRDVLNAEYRLLRGQTSEHAMQRLEEAADLLKEKS